MKDVIFRNMERLLLLDGEQEHERIEPMTEWKWQQLYKIAVKYGIGPWIADGIKTYSDDFFLQMSPTLRQEFLLLQGPKDENRLSRYLLQIERSRGFIHHLSKQSLKAYASELVSNIKNIEE